MSFTTRMSTLCACLFVILQVGSTNFLALASPVLSVGLRVPTPEIQASTIMTQSLSARDGRSHRLGSRMETPLKGTPPGSGVGQEAKVNAQVGEAKRKAAVAEAKKFAATSEAYAKSAEARLRAVTEETLTKQHAIEVVPDWQNEAALRLAHSIAAMKLKMMQELYDNAKQVQVAAEELFQAVPDHLTKAVKPKIV